MTIREKLKSMMFENGMFPEQAEAVLMGMEADESHDALTEVFGKEIEGYPVQFLAVAWLTTRHAALDWIDENIPLAWYRPMFEG